MKGPPVETLPPQVLVVDDDLAALRACQLTLRMGGIERVQCCQDPRGVMPLLEETQPSVILLDLEMPHLSGHELLQKIAEQCPQIPVIMVTSANDIETAVACMRDGAFDYIVKPIENSRLLSSVLRATEVAELRRACSTLTERLLSSELRHPSAFAAIVSASNQMRNVFHCIEAVAETSRPVLITGETGVGKEMVARALHAISRPSMPFVAVNLGGMDENFVADSLFGHKRGAFTGADRDRRGLIENAAGGTIFLDEVGELDPNSQTKLLRLIQEREYYPLGSDKPVRSDARVVTATNQDLEALQKMGRFRKDLYYRLCCHRVNIPPLRERKEDVPVLVDYFLEQAAHSLNKKKPSAPPELLDLLSAYSFPGNVRELEVMVFDAVSRHESKVMSLETFREHVQLGSRNEAPGANKDQSGTDSPFSSWTWLPSEREMEVLLTREALRRSNGNQTVAAQLLGITQSALSKRLTRFARQSE